MEDKLISGLREFEAKLKLFDYVKNPYLTKAPIFNIKLIRLEPVSPKQIKTPFASDLNHETSIQRNQYKNSVLLNH